MKRTIVGPGVLCTIYRGTMARGAPPKTRPCCRLTAAKRDGRGSPLVLIVVVHSSLGVPSVLDIVFGLGADIGRLFQTQGIHQMHERHHFRSGVLPIEQEGCGRVRKFLPDPAVCRLRKSRHPMAGCCCISPSSYGKAVQSSKSPARTISFMARISRIAEAADSDG
jgi:hypothetical protein